MNNKVIRVAQVLGHVAEGGVEAIVMNYYRHIDRTKVQFDFFVECTSKIIDKEEIEKLGGKVIIIPKIRKIRLYERELTKIFRDGKYDIVHAQKSTLNFIALKAAKKAGIKVRISHAHSTGNSKEGIRNILKVFLKLFSKKYATHLLSCGEKAGRWLFGNKTFDSGRVEVINNAVLLENLLFSEEIRNKKRYELGLKSEFVIGHIGRFMKQKNHCFLIDIFECVVKGKKDIRLLLIGDGPLQEKIKNKVRKKNLSEYVIFAGSKADAYNYYSAMDVFCLPSLYEGLPVVGIEAQANGLLCFVSNEVTDEVILSNYVIKESIKKSAQCWADRILEEYNKYKNNNCCRRVYESELERYNIKNEANKLLELYIRLLFK